MANILFKKSYLYKTFKNVPYDNLWNSKGVFTTVRIKGKPFKLLFFKEHIRNLNQSLKAMNIKFVLISSLFNKKFKNFFNNNIRYDHLLRIAVNNKKISFSLRKQKKIDKISYEEMLEMASLGAKIMQPHAIQDARLNRIEIDVKSSFVNRQGTSITKRKNIFRNKTITGLTSTKNDAKVTLVGVKDKPGVAASVFKPLSQNYINVDMVVQTSSGNKRETDITFTIKSDDLLKTLRLIKQNKKIKYRDLIVNKNVSKVSIIGVGMITTPGVTYRMFQTLAKKRINIIVISTSEIKISVLIEKKFVKKAISALHKEFKLD